MNGSMEGDSEVERRLLQEGGQTALASLFSAVSDRLERIVAFRLDPRIRGRIDAADILQETFLEASDRLPSFLESTGVSFFVWLRQRIHHLDRRARQRERDDAFGDHDGGDDPERRMQ